MLQDVEVYRTTAARNTLAVQLMVAQQGLLTNNAYADHAAGWT